MIGSAYMARATLFVNISQKKLVLYLKAAKNASRPPGSSKVQKILHHHLFSRLFKEKINDVGFFALYRNLGSGSIFRNFSGIKLAFSEKF